MNQLLGQASWCEANQAYLVAEFAWLKGRLHPESHAQNSQPVERTRAPIEPSTAIEQLAEFFGLSDFERDILLLCAGVEMDSSIAALCAQAQGHAQRACATFGLALAVLPEPHWSSLSPARPLRRFRLVEVEGGHGLTSAPIRIDERILHYLAGVNVLDQRLQPLLRVCPFPDWIADTHKAIAARPLQVLDSQRSPPPVFHFCGDDAQGQEDAAAFLAHEKELALFALDASDLPPVGPELNQFAVLWEREAMLLRAALLLRCPRGPLSAAAQYLAERMSALLFLACREPIRLNRPFVRFDFDKPAPAEQKRVWEIALGAAASGLNGTIDSLAEQFRLSTKTIFTTSALVTANDGFRHGELWSACRSLARPKLEHLAERVVPSADWDDLVLPEPQKRILRQTAGQVRNRLKVYETWGFATKGRRGLGVSALFAGQSGTGKTMAAEVLAGNLGLDLYRIDLSAVVSKYIGETEKNLKQVFDAAEEGGVLLLFDEADALFGKRSEVKDSHDRYANIEVGYLLQRIESYQGLAILTTNLKSSLDQAFQRRLRFTVTFPFPDAQQRAAIWQRIFPKDTPTQGLDPRRLAQLNVTGGHIRNIALNAAFSAAAAGKPVEMEHLLEAARLEAQKMERPLAESEIRGWV
jgi:ATPase family associated with various cellular activities (AAA)